MENGGPITTTDTDIESLAKYGVEIFKEDGFYHYLCLGCGKEDRYCGGILFAKHKPVVPEWWFDKHGGCFGDEARKVSVGT